ncbi:MAG: hypothetical protein ABS944_04830 [Solibacillus sp.]|jgi:hypothetical protein|uniref:hypothetical protein n=1 Tax=unclassified Solibacillus TaxID=2637870 RepID=UPI0030F4D345
MKEFKNRLKQELQQDVPFTNDIKQRLLQTKKIKRKGNWQVISVSIVTCFIIGVLLFTQFFPQNYFQTASGENELLPIIDDVSGLEVINPRYANIIGEQWMLNFLPMIVDKQASITYGDYVAFYGTDGLIVSTIFGLGNDNVTMNQGQILVNNKSLKVHRLNQPIKVEDMNNPFHNPYLVRSRGTTPAPFSDQTISTEKDELIVYDNNLENGNTILKIHENQLLGKVVGFQNFKLTFELTDEEQRVFTSYKMDYNIERLKDMTPQAIVKMFLLSDIEQDYRTYEALFTSNINEETESVRRYYEKTKRVRQEMFTKELNQLIIGNLFAGIENAHFEQRTDTVGVIKFNATNAINGGETELTMERNEQGIWQPAFSRAIY